MADSLRALIHDTLQFLQDPLRVKQPILASAEECSFFQLKKLGPQTILHNEIQKLAGGKISDPDLQQTQTLAKHGLCKHRPGVEIVAEGDSIGEIQSPSELTQSRGLSHQPERKNLLQTLPKTLAPIRQELPPMKKMILKTTVRDGKVMQDFDSESLPIGGSHSQMVKGPPVGNDSGSKGGVNLPSSTAVFRMIQKAAPAIKIVEQVPDDSEARRIAESWKEKVNDADVIFLLCDLSPETVDFLKSLAKAVDQHLAKTKILAAERLEREKRWDIFLNKNTFRLIIASEGMQKLPELMRFYKHHSGVFFLDKIPLVALSSASIYKSLEHKALLWKTLCQMLKK